MAINIGNYAFEGPFLNAGALFARSGVYAILGKSISAAPWNVVDIGESGDVACRVSSHDRFEDWKRQGHASLAVAALYCNASARMRIEAALRAQFNPPCGDR